MIKVAIYCRLSDEDRFKENANQDSESIQNQKTMLIDYAMQKKWSIYNIYSDDDYSGADAKRPEYNRLLKDAETKKFNIILCKSQSRFTRDMEHVEKYLHNKFVEWGIRFIGKVDNADTEIKGNKKSRQINGLVNEWYLEDASENIKAALISKKKQGQFVGSFAPYGYKKDPKNKNKLIVDEKASEVVKLIFKMYLEGKGLYSIARYLNEHDIPCPSEYKRLNNLNYKNTRNKVGIKLWEMTTVRYILHHRAYVGDIVQNKIGSISYKNQKTRQKPKEEWIIVKNMHEPIIDREAFLLVAELANERKRPRKNGMVDKYSGKLRCGECGGALYRNVSHSSYKGIKKPVVIHYRCKINKSSRKACKGSCITERLLDESIFNKINKLISSRFNKDNIDLKINEKDHRQNRVEKLNAKKEILINKIADADKAFTNLYMDKIKEVITNDQFSMVNQQLTEEKEKNEKLLLELENEIQKINNKELVKKNKQKIISKYNNIELLNNSILNDFIDHIVISNTKNNNQKKIKIHWNF